MRRRRPVKDQHKDICEGGENGDDVELDDVSCNGHEFDKTQIGVVGEIFHMDTMLRFSRLEREGDALERIAAMAGDGARRGRQQRSRIRGTQWARRPRSVNSHRKDQTEKEGSRHGMARHDMAMNGLEN